MPKDNENVPLPDWTTDEPIDLSPSPFAADQMVRCEECLRANPPTRLNCLYCAAVLPISETTAALQKPALRPLEKWERGYNNILLTPAANVNEASIAEASDLLRMRVEDLTRILASAVPLPLARAATIDEAQLVQRRLGKLGIDSRIMADAETGPEEIIKVRSLDIDDAGVYAYQTPETPSIHILWSHFLLFVGGRIVSKRVELKEQKAARSENRILSNSEFVTDETVVDFYTIEEPAPYRIAANSFNFSVSVRKRSARRREPLEVAAVVPRTRDQCARRIFNSVRKALEPVWPPEQQNESSGWRRERPGNTVSAVLPSSVMKCSS